MVRGVHVGVKLVGRISDWNDEKGFGFVIPHGGGTRAFVHVRSFQPGSRRPVNGDLISYQPTLDSRGRTNARNIVLAGQRVVEPKHERKQKRRRPLPRLALALVFAVSVVAGVVAGHVPVVLLFAYAAASVLSYVMYCLDKAAAGKKGRQRTPESTLHLVDFLGGWPGALIAQHEFRHKTVKASFQSFFWFTVLANIGLNAWLVHSGTAQVLAEMLSR